MALVSPIVTTLPVPALQITCPLDFGSGDPVNYDIIVASMPSANYSAHFFYVASPNCSQVSQVYSYSNVDITGNQINNSMPFIIEPYQNQCAAYFYPEPDTVVFNGDSSINFTMLQGQTLYFPLKLKNNVLVQETFRKTWYGETFSCRHIRTYSRRQVYSISG